MGGAEEVFRVATDIPSPAALRPSMLRPAPEDWRQSIRQLPSLGRREKPRQGNQNAVRLTSGPKRFSKFADARISTGMKGGLITFHGAGNGRYAGCDG